MFVVGAETAMSLYARVLLPLDTARQNSVATGLELGSSLRMPAGARWVIDGGLALAAPAEIVGGQTHLRFEPAALAEAWLRLRPGVALCGGAHVRLRWRPPSTSSRLRPGWAPGSRCGAVSGRPPCSNSRWPEATGPT